MKIICGRFALYHIDDGTEFFGVYNPLVSFDPSYNIGPQTPVPVITGAGRHMTWETAIWGITLRSDTSLQITIRAETLAAEGFFGDTKRRRCLIPANGYYEWTKIGHLKVPFYFSLRRRPLFAFAGTLDRTGKHCAIVTTSAHETVIGIHERMPAILSRSQYRTWLSGTGEIPGPYVGDDLVWHPVGQAVNLRFEDGPSLIEPLPESHETWW